MMLRLTAICSVASDVQRVQSEKCGTVSLVHLILHFQQRAYTRTNTTTTCFAPLLLST